MELISIGEIEDVQSVSSPHEEELKSFGRKWVGEFRGFGEGELDDICQLIGAEKEILEIDEEWALTKEFFPEVKTHLSYHYYGEEFKSVGEEDKLRFLFSGEKVREITGEDLVGMIDVTLKFVGRNLSEEFPPRKKRENKEKFLKPRREALEYLDFADDEIMNDLASFLQGHFEKEDQGIILWKEFFPEVNVGIELDEGVDFRFEGGKTDRLADYELNSLGVFALNHIIRYITSCCEDEDLPEICRKVFPRYTSD